jgi:ABC-2 type transport system permease protein
LIDLDILKKEPDERMFNSGEQPVAVLLEGNFVSDYQFRIPPELAENKELDFQPKSVKPTKMVVVADGDIIKNQFDISQGYPLPLGYDQYTRKTFGNKDFILNVMNYLCDDSGLITVRSRELTLRSLDMTKANKQRFFWQIVNTILPLVLVLGFALVKFRLRKRKYSRTVIQITK